MRWNFTSSVDGVARTCIFNSTASHRTTARRVFRRARSDHRRGGSVLLYIYAPRDVAFVHNITDTHTIRILIEPYSRERGRDQCACRVPSGPTVPLAISGSWCCIYMFVFFVVLLGESDANLNSVHTLQKPRGLLDAGMVLCLWQMCQLPHHSGDIKYATATRCTSDTHHTHINTPKGNEIVGAHTAQNMYVWAKCVPRNATCVAHTRGADVQYREFIRRGWKFNPGNRYMLACYTQIYLFHWHYRFKAP